MICSHCGREVIGDGILINADGDFVCDQECKQQYEKERDCFFNVILDDEKFAEWMDVEIPEETLIGGRKAWLARDAL